MIVLCFCCFVVLLLFVEYKRAPGIANSLLLLSYVIATSVNFCHLISVYIKWVSMIVRVNVVLNRTVVDSDSRFDNLCGSHLQCILHFDSDFVSASLHSIKDLLVAPAYCIFLCNTKRDPFKRYSWDLINSSECELLEWHMPVV